MSGYLTTTRNVYAQAAVEPQVGLCCTTTPVWQLPGLEIPTRMKRMNCGCGSTVHPRDLAGEPTIMYVGVGGGMELLQFAYFSRREGSIIGIDPVPEMLDACARNLESGERKNEWFDKSFIKLVEGDALELPVDDNSVDVAAQNCLFNIFKSEDLEKAIAEMYRVLRPHGRLVLSDPVCDQQLPQKLRDDETLRALCLSGVIPLDQYVAMLTDAGFGTIEIRARRPYRVLSPVHYDVDHNIMIESVEVCAIKDPLPADGPCVFTGMTAIYHGPDESFDDNKGHVLLQNQPLAVCDKTGGALASLDNEHITLTPSTWHYDGGGCC